MPEDKLSTRDRVRALVREVLDSVPPGDEAPSAESPAPVQRATVINVAPPAATNPTPADESPIARDESAKTLITEDDLRGLPEGARVRIAEAARLTPLAADLVRERRLELVRRPSRRGAHAQKLVAVGADHGGYPLKEELKNFLAELGHRALDFGTNSTDAVDYPDFAHAVARAVADREADLGIVIDGAGVGSAMTANKVPGVRAAACYSVKVAVNSREHNDANVLTLGSKTITSAEMREIASAWLATEITEDRHRKRVAKIVAIERQYKG